MDLQERYELEEGTFVFGAWRSLQIPLCSYAEASLVPMDGSEYLLELSLLRQWEPWAPRSLETLRRKRPE